MQTVQEAAPTVPRQSVLPLVAVSASVLAWGSAFVAIRTVGHAVAPGALTLGRLVVGSVVLGIVALLRRGHDTRSLRRSTGPLPVVRDWPTGREWVRLVVCGVLWFGLYNVSLNAAERRIDAGTAAMLVNIGPILIAILAGIMLGERFSSTFVAGCTVAFAGVIVIGVATSHSSATDVWGVALCLVAAMSYAIGVVTQKPLLASVSALKVTWLACTIGAVVCLPFAGQLVSDLGTASTGSIWLLVYLGAVPTALAFTTWAYALARTGAGRLGVTTYLSPPVAILLGWILLHETPATLAYVGGVLCLLGVALGRRKAKI